MSPVTTATELRHAKPQRAIADRAPGQHVPQKLRLSQAYPANNHLAKQEDSQRASLPGDVRKGPVQGLGASQEGASKAKAGGVKQARVRRPLPSPGAR